MIIEALVGKLASAGLNLIHKAIVGGGEKAAEFIEEKTGIPMNNRKEPLSTAEIAQLRQLEIEQENALMRFALEQLKENNRHFESLQQVVTQRHGSDMTSDSWLSKNVRPIVLVYLLTAYTIFAIASSWISIKPEFVGMLSDMLTAAFGFYFIGRTIEKAAQIIKGK